MKDRCVDFRENLQVKTVMAVGDQPKPNETFKGAESSPQTAMSSQKEVRFIYPSGAQPLSGYTIKRGIGRGGFGEVYYATSDLGKDVALKLLCRNWDIELRGINHCLNLKHPNLLTIYDVRRDDRGDTWVVMEYIAGPSLEQVLAEHPQGLPLGEAMAWFYGMAAAVAYLHEHGIVHRDLKPGNVFWEENVVKVGDYGLAKFISCSRRSGQTESVGTVHYMAPEIASGRYGKEIDVYALGVMLYEMLTGRVPFEGESVGEILMKHLTKLPDLTPLPPEVQNVVGRALEKDPQRRFQDVREMIALLPPPAQPTFVGPISASLEEGVSSQSEAMENHKPGSDQSSIVMAELAEKNRPEPLWHALNQGFREIRTAWDHSRLATPVKVIILIGVAFLLISHIAILAPLVFGLLMAYAVYWTVRVILIASTGESNVVRSHPIQAELVAAGPQRNGPPGVSPPLSPVPEPSRAEMFRQRLREMSWRAHVAEVLGSMLAAVVIAVVLAVVAYLVRSFHEKMTTLPQSSWVLFMTIMGSWAILVVSKLWQGREGDVIWRRFLMMVLGLGLGAGGFVLAEYLQADLPFDPRWPSFYDWNPPATFYRHGQPMLPALMAAFGTHFLLVRWWRLADPLRRSRFCMWGVLGPALAAVLVSMVWVFPGQWLLWPAVATGITVQLASPWFSNRRKRPLLAHRTRP
ncbi:MAG: serine/threonine-protein kinase [Thermogutta sp.]